MKIKLRLLIVCLCALSLNAEAQRDWIQAFMLSAEHKALGSYKSLGLHRVKANWYTSEMAQPEDLFGFLVAEFDTAYKTQTVKEFMREGTLIANKTTSYDSLGRVIMTEAPLATTRYFYKGNQDFSFTFSRSNADIDLAADTVNHTFRRGRLKTIEICTMDATEKTTYHYRSKHRLVQVTFHRERNSPSPRERSKLLILLDGIGNPTLVRTDNRIRMRIAYDTEGRITGIQRYFLTGELSSELSVQYHPNGLKSKEVERTHQKDSKAIDTVVRLFEYL